MTITALGTIGTVRKEINMVERRKLPAQVVDYGRGFDRMKARLGPEKAEALRLDTIRLQEEARAFWGGQPLPDKRDRSSYKGKGYPAPKKSKRGE